MRRSGWVGLSLLLWLVVGVAIAMAEPAKTVQSYLDAIRQGQFAEANVRLMETADLRNSVFTNWLFTVGGTMPEAATADMFLSRKFAEAFQYKITGTTANGENQALVSVVRHSPNLGHLYAWALAPKRGAAPYTLVREMDTYLTQVNFPTEQSRMEFVLIQEAESWYISAIRDENFTRLRQQIVSQSTAPVASAAAPLAPVAPTSMASAAPALVGPTPPGRPDPAVSANPSGDTGRQVADAQFNATLGSFNRTPGPSTGPITTAAVEPESGVLSKVKKLFESPPKTAPHKILARISDRDIKRSFKDIREAIAIYAQAKVGTPDETIVYDWSSLHKFVATYGRQAFPPTEELAGFRFVDYQRDGYDDFILLVELAVPQKGLKRVEISSHGVDRVQ